VATALVRERGDVTTDGIDHVGVAVRDLDAAAAAWARLGFAPTATARHRADGVPTGTANRCIMLGRGYVELIAVVDPAKPSATLGRFLARYEGIHVLTLAIADEQAALARLHRAGFAAAAIVASDRPADEAEPDGPRARFARIPLTDAEPRLQLLHQLTPELVWQERFLAHPNAAAALDEVIVVADPPAVFAARLSRAAGRPLEPDPDGGFALKLPAGRVRVLDPATAAAVLPGVATPSLPCIAAIAVTTADGGAAARRLVPDLRTAANGWLAMASGVAVVFR
jgi:hypothetical protein